MNLYGTSVLTIHFRPYKVIYYHVPMNNAACPGDITTLKNTL